MDLEHGDRTLTEAAAQDWDGLFKHPALGRNRLHNMDYHRPLDLLRQRLMPSAEILRHPRQHRDAGGG